MNQNKLPTPYICSFFHNPKPEREHNHEEDFEREQRRMEFLATQNFHDRELEEKDEE